MDGTQLLGIVLIGAAIGFVSGAFGKGGSAIATPLLHVIGVPALVAVASPLPATMPSTLLASRAYAREGHVDRQVLRTGLAVGLPATALGALLTRWIPGGSLIAATDVIVLALGIRLLVRSVQDDTPAQPSHPSTARLLAVVGAVGLISGLLGNSGGFLLAPLFINVLHLPIRRALGTSLALSAFLAVPGTIVHALLGHIDWTVTVAFGVAAVPLAALGATVALKIRERPLALAYGGGLVALAGGLLLFAH